MVTISHSIRPKNPINKAFIKFAIYSVVLKSSTYLVWGGAGAPWGMGGYISSGRIFCEVIGC